ncbi:hypothetical protein [Paenibacillus sp.]|uniref:hypothetical protein n=1 Tax=Paenibacillus sp. TaxID=58172 RepID=UPI0028AE9070|nr:hypothetical protein [Paenibacillus sp.]
MRFIQLPVELSRLKIAREDSHMILQHLRDLESTRPTLLLSLSFIGFFLQIISIILPVSAARLPIVLAALSWLNYSSSLVQ